MTNNIPYPRRALISDITQAQQAVVTFTEDPTFTIGEIISFRTSKADGMWQINNLQARVLAVLDDTVTIELDTLGFDPFIYPSSATSPPQAVPSASGIIPGLYPSTVNLQDAFDMRRA